jgi:hypothetical protein
MTTTAKITLSLVGLAIIGSGVVLWAHFGTVIIFDMASAAYLYCF